MDLNYLYQRYSVSLHMASNAACSCSRLAHRKLAEGYAARIADAKAKGHQELGPMVAGLPRQAAGNEHRRSAAMPALSVAEAP